MALRFQNKTRTPRSPSGVRRGHPRRVHVPARRHRTPARIPVQTTMSGDCETVRQLLGNSSGSSSGGSSGSTFTRRPPAAGPVTTSGHRPRDIDGARRRRLDCGECTQRESPRTQNPDRLRAWLGKRDQVIRRVTRRSTPKRFPDRLYGQSAGRHSHQPGRTIQVSDTDRRPPGTSGHCPRLDGRIPGRSRTGSGPSDHHSVELHVPRG